MSSTSRTSGRRRFWAVALLVTLLVAGVGSYYASSHPDGLEYVAEKTGFIDTAEDPVDTGSPFADYGTKGVEDERLSGGIAGVAGVGLTLLVGGGLFWLLRRRTPADQPGPQDDARGDSQPEPAHH
ncbi:cobalt/nickel transport system permease protein/cobalt/nickel transport protein [Nocardioides sp. J9]|uniref:PDGLE domain-containing protein n=1 Tax=unclassified Nocardioides TaxID=2615069 RepID=UPI0004B58A60|nr:MULTISPECIES: PDGLE domain-containing protein [unclassified Nocardioides]TWG97404.1 cobalt/nickel transport system permease protein/cobalt/nickel transport protein [Nocardioides sp. J9]